MEHVIEETDANDSAQAVYTLEPQRFGNLLSQRRGTTTNYFQFDGMGSTDRLTDGMGSVTDNYLYKSFGEIVGGTAPTSNSFRYVGKQGYYYDQTLTQYYLRARHYDPLLGHFLSRDPLYDALASLGQGSAFYAYVWNNPINATDPTGLLGQVAAATLGGCAASFIISGAVNLYGYLSGAKTGCQASVDTFCDTAAGCLIGALIGIFLVRLLAVWEQAWRAAPSAFCRLLAKTASALFFVIAVESRAIAPGRQY